MVANYVRRVFGRYHHRNRVPVVYEDVYMAGPEAENLVRASQDPPHGNAVLSATVSRVRKRL